MGRACGTHGSEEISTQDLGGVGNLEEKRVIGKPKYRWQNTIKIDLKK
jgi:hypothetical protein